MLIDLDRCTRCDECVRACANTHDDGHSRLFLVGPRQAVIDVTRRHGVPTLMTLQNYFPLCPTVYLWRRDA